MNNPHRNIKLYVLNNDCGPHAGFGFGFGLGLDTAHVIRRFKITIEDSSSLKRLKHTLRDYIPPELLPSGVASDIVMKLYYVDGDRENVLLKSDEDLLHAWELMGGTLSLRVFAQHSPWLMVPSPVLVSRVVALADNWNLRQMCKAYGLDITRVAWEDTARFKDSAVGPNISDMTLVVQGHQGMPPFQWNVNNNIQGYLIFDVSMPVIRASNFSDNTWDVKMDSIQICVANTSAAPAGEGQSAEGSKNMATLTDILKNPSKYSDIREGINLYSPSKDSHVVVSCQACFLPIEPGRKTKFNVMLYNRNAEVLVLMATSKGLSVQSVDRSSRKLYFNNNGELCSLIGQRLKDNRRDTSVPLSAPLSTQEKLDNIVLVVQIPLRSALFNAFSFGGSQAASSSSSQSPFPLTPEFGGPATNVNSSGFNFGVTSVSSTGGQAANWPSPQPPSSLTPAFSGFGAASSSGFNFGVTSVSSTGGQAANWPSPQPPSSLTPAFGGPATNVNSSGFNFGVATTGSTTSFPNNTNTSNNYPYSAQPSVPAAPNSASFAGSFDDDYAVENKSDEVQHVIVDYTQSEGVFPSLAHRSFERDERFPVRVTLQFYKATSTGLVTHNDILEIQRQFSVAMKSADAWGSLVLNSTNRPTEPSFEHI